MITITLSIIPPRVNAMYSSAGRFHKNQKAKDLVEWLQWEIKNQLPHGHVPFAGEIKMTIKYHFKNKLSDIDGALKATLDCGQGLLYENDKQISRLEIEKFAAQKEKVEITCEEIIPIEK